MDEKRIKEIVDDPNTWEWDGVAEYKDEAEKQKIEKESEELIERLGLNKN